VLISCEDKLVDSAIEEMRSIPVVTKVDRVKGMYDIMAQLEAPTETMKETIRTKLRYIDGVRSVVTLFVHDSLQLVP
jgi:DNA-binding Lrp family transcriptional regulator